MIDWVVMLCIGYTLPRHFIPYKCAKPYPLPEIRINNMFPNINIDTINFIQSLSRSLRVLPADLDDIATIK